MTRKLFILSLLALVLAGCSTTQPLCIDDAYHWQDMTTTVSETPKTTSSSSGAPLKKAEEKTPASPTLEFLNVQDTTVTVRINR